MILGKVAVVKSIEKRIVVGAGKMGSELAQAAAQAGLDVVVNDVTIELAELLMISPRVG